MSGATKTHSSNQGLLVIAVAASTVAAVAAILLANSPRLGRKRTTKEEDADADSSSSSSAKTVLECIQRRRSIFPKQYTGLEVSDQVINDMLEAARWAPTHHLSEPWHFITFETDASRSELGHYLANHYKQMAEPMGKFVQLKYEKKMRNCERASHVFGICVKITDKNPAWEDVCSVATAVQNMHLVASAHGVAAYWSTSGVHDKAAAAAATHDSQTSSSSLISLVNPPALVEFLKLNDQRQGDNDRLVCMGWMFVGDFDTNKSWPKGRRKPCSVLKR